VAAKFAHAVEDRDAIGSMGGGTFYELFYELAVLSKSGQSDATDDGERFAHGERQMDLG
jgi:hypothetical protein